MWKKAKLLVIREPAPLLKVEVEKEGKNIQIIILFSFNIQGVF